MDESNVDRQGPSDVEPPSAPDTALDAALDRWAPPVRAADIPRLGDEGRTFDWGADADLLARAADALSVLSVERLAATGRLSPAPGGGLLLEAEVTAEVTQACGVTLDPAPETVRETVERRWLPQARYQDFLNALPRLDDSSDGEATGGGLDLSVEGADETDLLGEVVRPGPVLLEATALGLDPYPRAPGVTFDGALAGPPGVEALTDDAAKPLAGLAALRAAMATQTDDKPDDEQ